MSRLDDLYGPSAVPTHGIRENEDGSLTYLAAGHDPLTVPEVLDEFQDGCPNVFASLMRKARDPLT